jgi:hypothetical protein
VVVGPRDGGVSISRRGHPSLHDEPESWYRSSNLREPADPDDTGEIPVVPLHREDDGTDEVPLYPPRTWMD